MQVLQETRNNELILAMMAKLFLHNCTPVVIVNNQTKKVDFQYRWRDEVSRSTYIQLGEILKKAREKECADHAFRLVEIQKLEYPLIDYP